MSLEDNSYLNKQHKRALGLALVLAMAVIFALLAIALSSDPKGASANDIVPSCAFDIDTNPNAFSYMQTYEYKSPNWKITYGKTLELAGFNQLLPEQPAFALPNLTNNSPGAPAQYIPPTLLKAIAWVESSWVQASIHPLVPYGSVGSTLVSFDCGYGIMQVTSGMQNYPSPAPTLEQAMTGGHFAFNIAKGARILADKWNWTWLPPAGPVVGDGNTSKVENWYYATWMYNGFAWSNHPLNPINRPNDPLKLPYSCGPEGDGFGHNRGEYTYQDLVFGCMAHPPVLNGAVLWQPLAVTLPDLNDPANAGLLDIESFNKCQAGEWTACSAMNIPTPSSAHTDLTTLQSSRDQVLGSPALAVSQTQVAVQAPAGSVATSAAITVTNPGTGLLAWRATGSAPWLYPTRLQGVALGSDLGGQGSQIGATVNAAGLAPGVYTGAIVVESLYAGGAPASIQVQLTVTESPFPPSPTPSPSPTPTPTPTPSPTPEPPSALLGDVDCSTEVNVIDALGILQYAAQLASPACVLPPVGNTNCSDGEFEPDVIDALSVLRYVAGIPIVTNGCPPIGSPLSIG